MLCLRQLALLVMAAGTVATAHAQPGDGDAARRMQNREEALARYRQMQPGGAPMAAPAPGAVRDGPRMHDHGHRHGHHRHHHMHRHPHHHAR